MRGVYRYGLAVLLGIAFSGHVVAQDMNDLKRNKLKGDITAVTELDYTVTGKSRNPQKDSLKLKSVTSYDSTGNTIEFVTYSPDDKVLSRSVYEYDADGKFVEIKRYRGDGTHHVTTKYEFDWSGNIKEEKNFDPSGSLFMTAQSTYRNGNRAVYDRYGPNGHLFLKSNYKFDKKGNEIEEREFDSHHGLKYTTTHKYSKYDKKGNWQQRVTYKNDEPRTITEREITYDSGK